MIVTVVHEVRWLPNDVEAKLSQIVTALQTLDSKIEALTLSVNETNATQIRALADEVKTVREKLQTSIDNQTKENN